MKTDDLRQRIKKRAEKTAATVGQGHRLAVPGSANLQPGPLPRMKGNREVREGNDIDTSGLGRMMKDRNATKAVPDREAADTARHRQWR